MSRNKVKYDATLKEIKARVREGGVRIYSWIKITKDDMMLLEIKKNDFLHELNKWTEDEFVDHNVELHISGNIFVG